MVLIVPTLIHVLVIAHPDDESMFFLPWIYYTTTTTSRNTTTTEAVWLLCLTTGNYDGLGKIRSQELYNVNNNVLQNIGFHKVILLDEPNIMPDHPKQRWDISRVAQLIHTTLQHSLNEEYGPNQPQPQRPTTMNFVTFDQKGVSGHVNHIDTYYAVQHLYRQQNLQLLLHSSNHTLSSSSNQSLLLATKAVTVYVLETIQNPIRKYIPLGEWIRLILFHWILRQYPHSSYEMQSTIPHNHPVESKQSKRIIKTYRLLYPSLNWYAMSTHQSQFVWYRRLFVIFSIYTYQNIFHSLSIQPPYNDDETNHNNNTEYSSQQPAVMEDLKKEL